MNKKFITIIGIYFIVMIAANTVHPITPEFIKVKQYPDFMFGVALAMMNLTSFIFANFWGYICDHIGRLKVLAIGLCGYAIGQLMFGFSETIEILLIARLVAGFFTGGFSVPIIAYISDVSTERELKKHLGIYVTLTSIAGAIGYYVGGLVGTKQLIFAFYLQVILLIISAILVVIFGRENKQFDYILKIKEMIKGLNPFQVFFRHKLSGIVVIMLGASFFIYFANTMFDSSFSYYLSKQLKQPPIVNGIIKATTGIITLILNLTLIKYLLKQWNVTKLMQVILIISFSILFATFYSVNQTMFFIFTLLFYIVFLCVLPLQMSMIIENTDETIRGSASGLIHGIRAIGGVVGSLVAGFIYGKLPILSLPYVTSEIAYPIIISMISIAISIGLILLSMYKKISK